MKITAITHVANMGHTVTAFEVDLTPASPFKVNSAPERSFTASEFSLTVENMGYDFVKTSIQSDVLSVVYSDGVLRIEVSPFLYRHGFEIKGSGVAADITFAKQDVNTVKTAWADEFKACKENGVLYRLYSPEGDGMRPLVLFLHGGGESGDDNWTQMIGTIGAAHIAEKYPDVYVMAPQAPGGFKPGAMPNMQRMTFATSDLPGESGWYRRYLAKVCDIIRMMIADGKVNPDRVYVTGMSMGGGGTLRALSVGSDLFAAAAPICPTMTPETYAILRGLVNTKLWISTAYVDHTIYRHKYIVDGIMHLRDEGNFNAKLTLYGPEELEKYGIATDPDMPLQAKFGANHASWVLTYNNEYGIMDWLMSQVK